MLMGVNDPPTIDVLAVRALENKKESKINFYVCKTSDYGEAGIHHHHYHHENCDILLRTQDHAL